MNVEIVTTGTELLLGQIMNTNGPFLAQRLNELGFNVLYQTTVGDNRQRMAQVLAQAVSRADIVITSGGLGPTQGDITKEVTAQMYNRTMYLHEASLERIKGHFLCRHASMPESNIRQAMMPEGAIVIDNERGTAPGVILESAGSTIINLPGPPYELEAMFTNAVVPYLQQRYGLQGTIISRVLHTYGIGESLLEEKISDFILNQSNPTLALLVRRGGEIIVRLTAKADREDQAKVMLDDLEEKIRQRIGEFVFGVDGETLAAATGKALQQKQWTIALAESCTGGLATSLLTDVAGSSGYVMGSIVSYDNRVKMSGVGVPEATLAAHGAVSVETALAMASGIRKAIGTDIGVGITGIAGPGGAVPGKPVGLVFMAIDGPEGCKSYQFNFSGERSYIKNRAAHTALNLIRQYSTPSH